MVGAKLAAKTISVNIFTFLTKKSQVSGEVLAGRKVFCHVRQPLRCIGKSIDLINAVYRDVRRCLVLLESQKNKAGGKVFNVSRCFGENHVGKIFCPCLAPRSTQKRTHTPRRLGDIGVSKKSD